MEDLNLIGLCHFNEFKSLKDLEIQKWFKIVNLTRTKDKFGPTIICELEDCKIHLPNRFIGKLDDKKIKELNRKNLELRITEFKTFNTKETALIEFRETE